MSEAKQIIFTVSLPVVPPELKKEKVNENDHGHGENIWKENIWKKNRNRIKNALKLSTSDHSGNDNFLKDRKNVMGHILDIKHYHFQLSNFCFFLQNMMEFCIFLLYTNSFWSYTVSETIEG